MLSLYKKILGNPFVYDRIRPLVVGGIDMRRLYDLLIGESGRNVLDVGCGTGDALRYLSGFESYLGIDTDPVAIDAAAARYAMRPGVRFACKMLDAADLEAFKPTGVVLSGVLHHLSDDEAVSLFQLLAKAPTLARVATSDIVFIPGKHFNNVLARLDRGRYCREPSGYEALVRRAGFTIEKSEMMSSSPTNDRVRYFVMSMVPAGRKS